MGEIIPLADGFDVASHYGGIADSCAGLDFSESRDEELSDVVNGLIATDGPPGVGSRDRGVVENTQEAYRCTERLGGVLLIEIRIGDFG